MKDQEKEDWLNSQSLGFVDRVGRPVTNRQAEEMLGNKEYRTVGDETFQLNGEDVRVSTVFLGLPHYKDIINNELVTFETMVFGGKYDEWQHRWKNAAIASKAHEAIVKALKNGEDIPYEDTNIFKKFLEMMNFRDNEGEEWKEK